MTAWTDERIPIFVSPRPGEALDSWLEAYAYRLKTVTLDFVDYLGLPHSSARKMVRRLTDHERDVLVRRTGLSAERLTAMTLEPYDGYLVRVDPTTRRLGCPPTWRFYGTTSRYCPACLGEGQGRWQVRWRLGWSFACIRHQLMLLDRCPLCQNTPPVASLGRHRVVPRPQSCRSLVGGPLIRCGFPLAEAPAVRLPAHGAVLVTQLEVNETVLADHRSAAVQERGGELAFLGRRALRSIQLNGLDGAPAVIREILDECGGRLPAIVAKHEAHDAHNTALAAALAAVATDLEHPSCEELFTWLNGTPGTPARPITVPREHPTSNLWNWRPAGSRVTSRILAASDGQLTLKARLRYGTATKTPAVPVLTEEDITRRAAKLPGMLWPSWTLRLLPPKSPHQPRIGGIRRACASLMLVHGGPLGHTKAARLMGNTHFRGHLEALLAFMDTDHLAGSLVHLARLVDEHQVPIDYARRRALFADETVELPLDEDSHRQICRSFGNRQFKPVHLERARWHLRRLLLGAEPHSSNHTPTWVHRFAYRMHPDIRAFLTEQAHEILVAHGIDEPVSWEPPEAWLDGMTLPIEPVDVTTDRLRTLL